MKKQDQIRAIAELCGWKVFQESDGLFCLFNKEKQVASYGWETEQGAWNHFNTAFGGNDLLVSRDAIISVIEKNYPDKVGHTLADIIACDTFPFGYSTGRLITATPAQLAEALLRATGKWKDEA